MSSIGKTSDLRELLDFCSDKDSGNWEYGWKEFLKRYKLFIYKNVTKTCMLWNVTRLQKQLSDFVNDVVSEVIFILCKNECQALRNFRARDNERMFLSWLATICNRTSSHCIQRNFTNAILETDVDSIKNYVNHLEFDLQWVLYEHLIEKWRTSPGKKRKNLERDIHIFQLYAWADFSPAMISSIPCLRNIGHRVVDNVVNRMRKYVKDGEDKK